MPRSKLNLPVSIALFFSILSACGDAGSDLQETKEEKNPSYSFQCDFRFFQKWPKTGDSLELDGYEYLKKKVTVDFLSLKDWLSLNESEFGRADKDRSVADSPNLNNFLMRMKRLPNDLARERCGQNDEEDLVGFEFQTRVTVRDFERNVTSSTLHCLYPNDKKIILGHEIQFGSKRKATGKLQQSFDDLEDPSVLDKEAPSAISEIKCKK